MKIVKCFIFKSKKEPQMFIFHQEYLIKNSQTTTKIDLENISLIKKCHMKYTTSKLLHTR